MFSDFENHVLGVPQIASTFGVGTGNVVFDGPGDLVAFVRDGLLDPKAQPDKLCKLVPSSLPSDRSPAVFEDCE